MRPSAAALTLVAALTLSALAPAAEGVPCSFYGINPGPPVEQGQILLDAAYAASLAASGARVVRIEFRLDQASSWSSDKLAEYDSIVDAVRVAGLEPVGLLADESVLGDQDLWNDDIDGDGYNDYVEDFASASEALLSHFEGRIRRWEIWNEPNCFENPDYATDPQSAGCTYLLPRVFGTMLAEIYLRNEPLFKSGAVSLVSGGLLAHDVEGSFFPGTDYLEELYALGPWDSLEAATGRRHPWDSIGYHLYVDQDVVTDGSTMSDYLDLAREVLDAYGDRSPLSITEIGWSTGVVNEEVQAANLTTAMTILSARGDVIDAFWFSYRDAFDLELQYGLVTEEDAPKLSLSAMQQAAAGCDGEDGPGGGGGGGAGSGSGTGSTGAGSSQTPSPGAEDSVGPYGLPRGESSCSCAVVGAEAPRRDAAWLALLPAAAALAVRPACRRRRTPRDPAGRIR